jgi:hypothetical protein
MNTKTIERLLAAAEWMKARNIPRVDGEDHDVAIARLRALLLPVAA